MEFSVHYQVLAIALLLGGVVGATASKTNFCTMGAVSDWVNMGDTGRLRAWMLAMAVAMLGVTVLEASGRLALGMETFPPYRTTNFAWLRHLLGGLMFGVGMTLASGCGNKTLVRIGGGNLKSLAVLVIAAGCTYAMLWTDFYNTMFNSWISATTVDLGSRGLRSQALGDLIGGGNTLVGGLLGVGMLGFVFSSKEFRGNADHVLGGLVIGFAVVVGWWVTGGALGQAWKEFADFAVVRPLRVETQSLTFISPMGDLARAAMSPANVSLINFGIMAMVGVMLGAFVYAAFTRGFRLEWFASVNDAANHAAGAVLMGVGGVLAMGCTVGQGITGISTLALGAFISLFSIIAGAAATMKYLYWRMS